MGVARWEWEQESVAAKQRAEAASELTACRVNGNGNTQRRNRTVAKRLKLRLYVVGNAPNPVRAIASATALCETHFAGASDLENVDLPLFPARAIADGIVVTPTLLQQSPAPVQRVIGNLSDSLLLLHALGGP